MPLSAEQQSVVDYVKTHLGHPVLCVELDESSFAAALSDAEVWLLTHMAPLHEQSFQMVSGQSEYSVLPEVDSIVDVAFPKAAHDDVWDESAEDFYGPVPWSRMGGGSAGLHRYPQSGLMQVQQMAESATRVLSNDPTWVWSRTTRKLIIRPDNTTGTAIYWYTTQSLDYSLITIQHLFLLRKYAIASAKMMLGNIRSKYNDLPAAGGRVSLNGSDLVSQAQEEFMTLDEKIKALAVPMPFITG